ncbi:sulfatase-like hydrolase/transferase [Nanohaloarchaea archaeon H01]|nr:sulfatase-like hydrolase/transferase [Nanohaloarchaea archaeon H01]
MDEQKSVVVLLFDSLRRDKLSTYNDKIQFTPNFRSLSEESTVYRNATANAPWTLPSVSSIFTGQYPWDHGATHRNVSLDSDRKLLAEKFSEEGYKTKVITPNTWISPSVGTTRGFDEVENFLGIGGNSISQKILSKARSIYESLSRGNKGRIIRLADIIFENFAKADVKKSRKTVEETKSFLQDVGDEEFFLFVNVMSAHEPYDKGDPPRELLEKHDVSNVNELPSTEKDFFNGNVNYNNLRKAYEASVEYSDKLLGEILDTLEQTGLKQEVAIVALGDHGQALGEDDVFAHQFTVMDSVVDVPLMVREPGGNASTEDGLYQLKQLYEIIPRIAGLSDVDIDSAEEVRGGYEYPEFFAGIIPDEKRDKYDVKYQYLIEGNQKIIKQVDRSGEEEYRVKNRAEGKEKNVTEEHKNKIDNDTSNVGGNDQKAVEDEEVKERLKDLGYM